MTENSMLNSLIRDGHKFNLNAKQIAEMFINLSCDNMDEVIIELHPEKYYVPQCGDETEYYPEIIRLGLIVLIQEIIDEYLQ